MSFLGFYKTIKTVFNHPGNGDHLLLQVASNKFFLGEFEKLLLSDKTDNSLKMTRASILFEGFYRHLDNSELKKRLAQVKAQRWSQHFGTSTVPFLLTYKRHLEETKQLFDQYARSQMPLFAPWLVTKEKNSIFDKDNKVLIAPHSSAQIEVPSNSESTDKFTKRYNPFDGFTVEHSAYINRAGQFPEDLLEPEQGRESVGVIAVRM